MAANARHRLSKRVDRGAEPTDGREVNGGARRLRTVAAADDEDVFCQDALRWRMSGGRVTRIRRRSSLRATRGGTPRASGVARAT
jgi:hypothetical protein